MNCGWVATISLKLCILAYKYQRCVIFEFLSVSAWEANRRIIKVPSIWVNCHCCIVKRMQLGLLITALRCLKTQVCWVYSPFSSILLFLAFFKVIFSVLCNRDVLHFHIVFPPRICCEPELVSWLSWKFQGNSICWRKSRSMGQQGGSASVCLFHFPLVKAQLKCK